MFIVSGCKARFRLSAEFRTLREGRWGEHTDLVSRRPIVKAKGGRPFAFTHLHKALEALRKHGYYIPQGLFSVPKGAVKVAN